MNGDYKKQTLGPSRAPPVCCHSLWHDRASNRIKATNLSKYSHLATLLPFVPPTNWAPLKDREFDDGNPLFTLPQRRPHKMPSLAPLLPRRTTTPQATRQVCDLHMDWEVTGIVSTLILIAGYASTCSSTILPARISAGHLRMLFPALKAVCSRLYPIQQVYPR